MFFKIKVGDHIRVPPNLFGLPVEEAILQRIKAKYDGYISKDLGMVIDVSDIGDVMQGVIIPGDGAAYYETKFDLLCFKPELQEVLLGKIKDIVDFGAFISLGPAEGMIHVSQTMDDYVSFSKDKVLVGKETKRTLRVNDLCRARVIAVSYKDVANPKLGLTMRQGRLGKLEWMSDEEPKKAEKPEKAEKPGKAGKKEGK
jgi:DNA-directed RNA polymerase subunit E'